MADGQLARQFGLGLEQVAAMWQLCGNLTGEILGAQQTGDSNPHRLENIAGSVLPRTFARWVIEHERVERLEDLVERRLMLLYSPHLSRRTLEELADLLVAAGRLEATEKIAAIDRAIARLASVYGRQL